MLRQGKSQGWLSLSPEAFHPWTQLNGVRFHDVRQGHVEGRGSALLASKDVENSAEGAECLLTVPKDLILSQEQVHEQAKVDRDFRELLESLGDFGRRNLMGHETPRGAIVAFILYQATLSCPDLPERFGVHSPFTDYVKFLPLENLPTFWTAPELRLLTGTTLLPATTSKLASLRREHALLTTLAASTRWHRLVGDRLTLDDWLQADAMYRSRALDYPRVGHCMVPCVDLANHAAHEETVAVYDVDSEGNAVLALRPGKKVRGGEEVTISYGDEKGACEMLFSYGFLDARMQSAETLFLSLALPAGDALGAAKREVAGCAPGFKIVDAGDGEVDWTGEFVWLLCVGPEDGLSFEVARTVEGEEEVRGFWKGEELEGGAPRLYALLGKSRLWEVYRLRAVMILQQRVFDQMQVLYASQEELEGTECGEETEVRREVYEQAMALRRLEFELMERAYEDFERQKLELAESDVVKAYLAEMQAPPAPSAADDGRHQGAASDEHQQQQGQADEDFS
ncbi:hypothetical protein WHR41_06016 [Cladosporium halotolerans]|uniref:SET domain-containing protein n=1 Tax=Cladosporium halotolerans TaxID=1052096 RepID=A0AB34KPF6_9PEZI